ncbi:hypothetical protein E2I00_011664, partial [Balaenoptera physalus]
VQIMQSTFLETGYWAIPGPEHNCCLMWGRSRGWEAAGGLTSGQGARGSLRFLRKEGSRQTSWDPDAPLELGPKSGPPVILELLSAPRTPLERGLAGRRGRSDAAIIRGLSPPGPALSPALPSFRLLSSLSQLRWAHPSLGSARRPQLVWVSAAGCAFLSLVASKLWPRTASGSGSQVGSGPPTERMLGAANKQEAPGSVWGGSTCRTMDLGTLKSILFSSLLACMHAAIELYLVLWVGGSVVSKAVTLPAVW